MSSRTSATREGILVRPEGLPRLLDRLVDDRGFDGELVADALVTLRLGEPSALIIVPGGSVHDVFEQTRRDGRFGLGRPGEEHIAEIEDEGAIFGALRIRHVWEYSASMVDGDKGLYWFCLNLEDLMNKI